MTFLKIFSRIDDDSVLRYFGAIILLLSLWLTVPGIIKKAAAPTHGDIALIIGVGIIDVCIVYIALVLLINKNVQKRIARALIIGLIGLFIGHIS